MLEVVIVINTNEELVQAEVVTVTVPATRVTLPQADVEELLSVIASLPPEPERMTSLILIELFRLSAIDSVPPVVIIFPSPIRLIAPLTGMTGDVPTLGIR
jgi:hypothetical protein